MSPTTNGRNNNNYPLPPPALSGPRAAPRVPRATRRGMQYSATAASHGSTALHQLQEVRTSQWKHRMLPQLHRGRS